MNDRRMPLQFRVSSPPLWLQGPVILALLLVVVLSLGWVSGLALANPVVPRATPPGSTPSYLDQVMQRVSEFKLANGLKFIVMERHQAPVVSFLTYANVGGVDEPEGQTGVAHYLEHLAFKGTRRISTLDYAAEKPLLQRLDQLFGELQAARTNGNRAEVQRLETEFKQVQAEADRYVVQNQMGRIVSQAGGVGLNANTSTDATRYFYSFPANKLELWMSLESERFLEPVFREFFKEKEVILEERQLRTENSPIGQMMEAFLDTAFRVHPYRRPVIGYSEDIRNLSRQNVEDFFDTYYGPGNLTIALVGDVNPVEVQRLAQIYFGRYPAKPAPPRVTEVEPPQTAPREVTLELVSQPWYLEGYHRPAIDHPDHVVYDLIASLLSDGRTSRLYHSLVAEQQLALTAQGISTFPGNKYPSLMLFYGLTAPGHSVEEVAQALAAEIQRLQTEPVAIAELERVKRQARANLLRSLDSNSGMARLLLEYEVKTGSWRHLFEELEQIAAVTPADIQRVARSTFTSENRTVGRLLSKPT